MQAYLSYMQFLLRFSLGAGFIVADLDRFGLLGPPGTKGVSWGNWEQFSIYAHKLMPFFPYSFAEFLAIVATIAELIFGILLIIGLFTRWASIGSALVLFGFALSMAISLGIHAPVNYSVFTAAAGAFLLASAPKYKWSIDDCFVKYNSNTASEIPVL